MEIKNFFKIADIIMIIFASIGLIVVFFDFNLFMNIFFNIYCIYGSARFTFEYCVSQEKKKKEDFYLKIYKIFKKHWRNNGEL